MKKSYLLIVLLFVCLFVSDFIFAEEEYAVDLNKIVITASRLEQLYKTVPANISIVTEKEIEDANTIEIAEILDTLPGVDILEYGSVGSTRSVHTRGASSNQVITLVDGRPVNTPRDGVTDLNQISLTNVERIEVLRGPASNIYGANAIGGVINVITKCGKEKPETKILNKWGSFNSKVVTFSHGNKFRDFDIFLSQDYLETAGHRDNMAHHSTNTNIKLGYDVNEDNRLTLSGGYYKSRSGTPGFVTNQDLDDRTDMQKKWGDLTWRGKLWEDQDILVKIYQNWDRLEFIEAFDPQDKDTHLTKIYGTDVQLSQLWFNMFRTTLGFSGQEHKLNSSSSAKHDYNFKAFYFESEADLFEDDAVIKFGLRWDDYSNFGDELSPSLSYVFWLWDKVKVHSLVARSFRAPTFNDLYWPREDWGIWGGVEGNSDLTPERATSYEFGIGGYPLENLKLDATYFRTDYTDLILWTMDNAFWWRPVNVGDAYTEGVELEAVYTHSDKINFHYNYTYLQGYDKDTDKWLTYRPRGLSKLRINYWPIEKLGISIDAIYKTVRYADTSNTFKLKPYFTLDFSSTYKVSDNLDLIFQAYNFLDRKYEEELYYSMPGRSFYGGFRLKF